MPVRAFNLKIASILAASIAVVLLGGLFYIGYFGDHHEADCETYPVQRAISPSGRLKAEQDQQACSSTDRLRVTVTIAPAEGVAQPVQPAIAFVGVRGDALGSMATGQRAAALLLRWEGDEVLVIGHPPGLALQFMPGTYAGVRVRYEVIPRALKQP